jgi:TRAP-type C4-dicarboxylate transport system substrate-binding protein
LKGKKMRVQESPVHMMMYKAYGAAAVPTPVTEVPQALATGNIDGFDQAVLYAIAAGWHSSVKHFTLSQHIYQPAAIVFNGKWFNTLPKDLQKIVVEEGRNVQDKGRKAVRSILPDLYDILKSEKIALHELSDSERQAFVDASKPVYAEFRKTFGAKASELLDQVEVELKVMRGK